MKIVIWLLVLGGIGYGGWHWYQGRGTAPAEANNQAGAAGGKRGPSGPITISTAIAREMDFEEWSTVAGTVTPLDVVVVRSRVDGQLMKVHFIEGAMVKEGDLLAEIDPRSYQVLLDQAKGQKSRDEALLQNAQVDLKRYQILLTQDSIAKQQVDAQASLVSQYEAAIEADTASVEAAQLQLDFTRIEAPLTGRVGLRQVDPGNQIKASDANGLVSITRMDPMGLIFAIPQELVPQIQHYLLTKTEVPVEALAADQKTTLVKGKLRTSDNQIDLTSGTLKLKAEFPNTDHSLFPNQFVNVRLRTAVMPKSVVVPVSAVQESSRGRFVYVVKDDNTVEFRTVERGATYREVTRIEKGLSVGERVVTAGLDRLRDGSQIQLSREDGEKDLVGQSHSGEGHAGKGHSSGKSSESPTTVAPEAKTPSSK